MKLRIIIVDTDESILKLLTILANKMGHEVVALSEPTSCPFYSGNDSKCSQDHPCGDLLILNNKMTKITGLKFIEKQMKGGCKGATRNKLVLSSSANSTAENEYAKKLGCTLIKKPFHLNKISEWIADHEKTIAPNRKLAALG